MRHEITSLTNYLLCLSSLPNSSVENANLFRFVLLLLFQLKKLKIEKKKIYIYIYIHIGSKVLGFSIYRKIVSVLIKSGMLLKNGRAISNFNLIKEIKRWINCVSYKFSS